LSTVRIEQHTGGIETVSRCHAAQRFAPPGEKLQDSVLEARAHVCWGWCQQLNQDRVHVILDLAAPLTDLSQVGKMRDAYPFVLTRLQNILRQTNQNAFSEAVALLPLSLCFNAMRLETITRETRIDLLGIAFFLVWKLHELRIQGIDTNPEKPRGGRKRTIFTSEWMIHFLNTVLSFLFPLSNYSYLALDRLSTHPLENLFGFVRWDANNINTVNEMIGTITHTDIIQEADRALELEEHDHHRAKLVGVHIDENPPHAKTFYIEMLTNLDPEAIAGISITVVHIQHGIPSDNGLVAFLQFRDYLTLIATAAAAGRTSKEIKQWFTCGSGSRIVSMFHTHHAPASDGLNHKADAHSLARNKPATPNGQTQ
jgi:hypothetical protein